MVGRGEVRRRGRAKPFSVRYAGPGAPSAVVPSFFSVFALTSHAPPGQAAGTVKMMGAGGSGLQFLGDGL